MSRLERLLNLTAALLSTSRPLSAYDIHERVPGYPEGTGPTFRRAFERDKDALREMGVPIRTEPIEGTDPPTEGYRIRREEYELRDPGLEPDELAALRLATLLVQVDGLSGRPALWKLGGVAEPDDGSTLAVVPTQPQLVPLWRAVSERRVATFTYRDETRTLEPWRLSYARGHWYVEGHDAGRGETRRFRVDRMGDAVELGPPAAFDRPRDQAAPDPHPWELGGTAPIDAVILVDPDQASWAVGQVGEDAVVRTHADGSVELRLAVTNPEGFRSFVLGFLDHAVILEPQVLRDDLVGWLEAMTVGVS